MTKDKVELPKEVISYLDKNTAFNIFGFVNLNILKASTECTIEDKTLKRLIQNKFGKEMATGKVEFITAKK